MQRKGVMSMLCPCKYYWRWGSDVYAVSMVGCDVYAVSMVGGCDVYPVSMVGCDIYAVSIVGRVMSILCLS